MSIKRFCDICKQEMDRNVTSQPLQANENKSKWYQNGGLKLRGEPGGTGLNFIVRCGTGLTINGGDLCKYCVIDAINTLDDRPKDEALR